MPTPEIFTFTPYEAAMTRIIRRNVPLVERLKTALDASQGSPVYIAWRRGGEASMIQIDETVVQVMYGAAREARLNLAKSRGATVAIKVFKEANQLRKEDLTIEDEGVLGATTLPTKELGPRELAERFLDAQRRNEVIPPDDRNLSEEDEKRRITNRTLSSGRLRYMAEIEEILKAASISDFFRLQLIHEAGVGYATGLIEAAAIVEGDRTLLGISLDEGSYGIFDPETAPKIERDYFSLILPLLQWRESIGQPNLVSWQEWRSYLEAQAGR